MEEENSNNLFMNENYDNESKIVKKINNNNKNILEKYEKNNHIIEENSNYIEIKTENLNANNNFDENIVFSQNSLNNNNNSFSMNHNKEISIKTTSILTEIIINSNIEKLENLLLNNKINRNYNTIIVLIIIIDMNINNIQSDIVNIGSTCIHFCQSELNIVFPREDTEGIITDLITRKLITKNDVRYK